MPDFVDWLRSAVPDRYHIERELGAGGMAMVYLAEDRKHGRKVAVKVLRPELAATLGPERFVREIEIAAKLTHPHILPLYDSGEADGFLYYVMPYVEGETLRARLEREGKLPVEEAVRLADDIAAALSYAHDHGIVHRDIKPENIMLTGGRAVVMDFGIALAVEAAGGERLTGTGLAIGTPAYMSPEQAMGLSDVDARSDVYALGCVIYEMVAGQPPFDGTTPRALLARHAVDTVPRLRTRDPRIPLFLERAVERALSNDPDARFPSVRAFGEALTSGTVVPRVGRRRRLLRTITGALGVVLVAAAAWRLSTMATGPAIKRLAVLPFNNLTNAPEQEYLVQGVHTGLIDELAMAGAAVIARRSVMQFQSVAKPVRDIARELGVDAVVEATVQTAGDSVRIRAQLVDGRTEQPLWTQTYDGELRNLLALQRAVVRAIVDQIQLPLALQAAARLADARAVNPEAYDAYLKGRFLSYKTTPENLEAAMGYFQSALQKEPNYALAYSGIGAVWWLQGNMLLVPFQQAHAQAKAAALKAIELDDRLAEGHDVLARIFLWYEWDWPAAEGQSRRAIELNPNSPDARTYYSILLMTQGRSEEAQVQLAKAIELDPLNSFYHAGHAYQLGQMRRYDDAIAHARKTLTMAEPFDVTFLHQIVWRALHQKGMYPEALAEAKAFLAADPEVVEALTRGYAEGGYAEANRHAAEKLAARGDLSFWELESAAILYAFAGEKARALDLLEKGYQTHHSMMSFIGVDPHWDALRPEPRFRALLQKLNLPQAHAGVRDQ